jgi:hypothetical protein
MELFPSYLNRKPESVKGTGNAVIPALVTWKIDTETTEKLEWMENSTLPFRETKMSLHYLKNISQNTDYQIVTSNNRVEDYEN